MPEYIKRVGEEHGKDLRKALAQKLKEQQTEAMPEIRGHGQGIAEALKRGLHGWELGSEIGSSENADRFAKEQEAESTRAFLQHLGQQSGADLSAFGGDDNMTPENIPASRELGQQMAAQPQQSSMAKLRPEHQNILIEQQLQNAKQGRKEHHAEELQKNQFSHAEKMLGKKQEFETGPKVVAAVKAHEGKKQKEAEIKKGEEWSNIAEKAANANEHIKIALATLPNANTGTLAGMRSDILTAAETFLNPKEFEKFSSSNADTRVLSKVLADLYIDKLGTIPGGRILKTEAEEARKSIANISDPKQAIAANLEVMKTFNDYFIYRDKARHEWIKRNGSLDKDQDGVTFDEALDYAKQHNIFGPALERRMKNAKRPG